LLQASRSSSLRCAPTVLTLKTLTQAGCQRGIRTSRAGRWQTTKLPSFNIAIFAGPHSDYKLNVGSLAGGASLPSAKKNAGAVSGSGSRPRQLPDLPPQHVTSKNAARIRNRLDRIFQPRHFPLRPRAHAHPLRKNIPGKGACAESRIDDIESQENALEFFIVDAVNSSLSASVRAMNVRSQRTNAGAATATVLRG